MTNEKLILAVDPGTSGMKILLIATRMNTVFLPRIHANHREGFKASREFVKFAAKSVSKL